MKDSIKKVVLGSTTLLAAGAVANVAEAATDGVPIQAIIVAPVDITQSQTMNFGSLTESGAGGTAVLDDADNLTPGAGITSLGGTIQSGGFQLKGTATKTVQVTAPASVQITSGANKMTVNAFTIEGAASPYTHTMVAATDTGLRIGGTLNIGAAQPAGTYNGVVTLTAVYN